MSEICREPLKTSPTWLGPELSRSDDWLHPDAEDIARNIKEEAQ